MRVLLAGLLLGAACLCAAPAAAAPAPLAAERARPAADFVDSVGVNVHFGYTDTSYARAPELLDALRSLGVRHVRDSLPVRPGAPLVRALRQLPERGIHVDLVLGSAGTTRGSALPAAGSALAAASTAGLRPAVESLEAPNEWDLRGGVQWLPEVLGFQRDLQAAVSADPRWRGVPVVGPSVGRRQHIAQLAGTGGADIANLHNYARGGPPEQDLQAELGAARAIAPGRPLYVTETGYHTALEQKGRQSPVSEQARADYLVRTLLENFRAGVARTYVYQLADGRAEPRNQDQEQHFGLLRSDLRRTPAYDQVRAVLGLLSDPSPAFAPTPLPLRVDGDVQHLLLQKRDGSSYLVLWRQGTLYEDGRDRAGSASVVVALGDRSRQIALAAGAGPLRPLGAASEVRGVVGNSVVMLRLSAQTSPAAGAQVVSFDAAGPAVASSEGGHRAVWIAVGVALAALLAAAGAGVVVLVRRRAARRQLDETEDGQDWYGQDAGASATSPPPRAQG